MADDEGRHAERPAEAQREHEQHQQGFAETEEAHEEETERQREGDERRVLAVAERGGHLVVGERGLAGDTHLDVRELALELRDHRADAFDRALIAREAAALALGLRQDEQEPLVVREEVPGARIVGGVADGEERAPWRPVGRGPLEPCRDLGDEILDELDVQRRLAVAEAEVDEA